MQSRRSSLGCLTSRTANYPRSESSLGGSWTTSSRLAGERGARLLRPSLAGRSGATTLNVRPTRASSPERIADAALLSGSAGQIPPRRLLLQAAPGGSRGPMRPEPRCVGSLHSERARVAPRAAREIHRMGQAPPDAGSVAYDQAGRPHSRFLRRSQDRPGRLPWRDAPRGRHRPQLAVGPHAPRGATRSRPCHSGASRTRAARGGGRLRTDPSGEVGFASPDAPPPGAWL